MKTEAAQRLGIEPFDAADYLETEEDCAEYLTIVLGEDDPAALAIALGAIARSRGMSGIAREAGLTREGLYKALGENGNPTFSTIQKVMRALGLQLSVQPIAHA